MTLSHAPDEPTMTRPKQTWAAWHVAVNDTFCTQDVWTRLVLTSTFSNSTCCFTSSPLFFGFIINALLATGMATWDQGWSVLAPLLLWIVGLIVTLWLGMLPLQDDNPEAWHVVDGIPRALAAMASIGSIQLPPFIGLSCEEPSQRHGPPEHLEALPLHCVRAPATSLLSWTAGRSQQARWHRRR